MAVEFEGGAAAPPTALTTGARQWRASKVKAAPPERLVVDLLLPSGVVIKASRPNFETYMAKGLYPEALLRVGLESWGRAHSPGQAQTLAEVQERLKQDPALQDEATLRSKLSTLDTIKYFDFVHAVVTDTVVHPRLVDTPPDDDDDNHMWLGDVPEDDFWFIYRWATEGASEVPVQTGGGSVPMAGLKSTGGKRKRAARAGADV